MPSDQLQSLVAHNARSYSCYRRFVMLRRNWKWSPVSHQLLSVSSESWNQDEAQLFCQSNVVIGSGIVMLRFWSVIGGFVENLFTCSSLLLSKLLSWRGSSHPDDHGQWSSRSGPLLTFLQKKNENPFPSCRYRRSNGGWCLPTSSGRGAPGTSPGAPSGCGSRRWIMDNCCNISIVIVFQVQGRLKRGSAII